MVRLMYSLYDLKAQVWSLPYYQFSDVLAKRDLHVAINDEEGYLFNFPQDFVLYRIGSFDDDSGHVHSYEPIQICVASEVKD